MSTLTRDSAASRWPLVKRATPVLALAALCALAGCASRMDGAPVVDRSTGGALMGTTDVSGPAPAGFYRVKPGDTLYRVALENGQNYRDIALWNNLTNPNQIEVGQLLRVAAPGTNPADSANGAGVATTPLGNSGVQSAPLGASEAPNAPGAPGTTAGPGEVPSSGAPVVLGPAMQPGGPGASTANGAPAPSAPGDVGVPTAPPGSISLIWPAAGPVLAQFDGQKNKGLDIGGAAGSPVVAAAGGRILYAGSGLRGYGNLVIIKHDDKFLTAYAHNRALLVKEGDVVARGQKIAEMGDTGAPRVMLHFEVRKDSKPVDPMTYLPPR